MELVVVDNQSTDTTLEELQKARAEFGNLRVIVKKCSRGLGRRVALQNCQDKSFATFVDLDMVYEDTFHELLHYGLAYLEQGKENAIMAPWVLYAKKEELIDRGSWLDLNYAEDAEFYCRMALRFNVITMPVLVAGIKRTNFGSMQRREKRYAKGLFYRMRVWRNTIDMCRGMGFTLHDVLSSHRRGLYMWAYPVAKLRGIVRYNPSYINIDFAKILMLRSLSLPESLGFNKMKLFLALKFSAPDEGPRKLFSETFNLLDREIHIEKAGPFQLAFRDHRLKDRFLGVHGAGSTASKGQRNQPDVVAC